MILPQKELDYRWPLISGLGQFNVQYCKVEKDSNTLQGNFISSTNIGAMLLKLQFSEI